MSASGFSGCRFALRWVDQCGVVGSMPRVSAECGCFHASMHTSNNCASVACRCTRLYACMQDSVCTQTPDVDPPPPSHTHAQDRPSNFPIKPHSPPTPVRALQRLTAQDSALSTAVCKHSTTGQASPAVTNLGSRVVLSTCTADRALALPRIR